MSITTIRSLASELAVPVSEVELYVDQLVSTDGQDAVIAREETITNASGRAIGIETFLTPEAAGFLRQMHAAGSWEV